MPAATIPVNNCTIRKDKQKLCSLRSRSGVDFGCILFKVRWGCLGAGEAAGAPSPGELQAYWLLAQEGKSPVPPSTTANGVFLPPLENPPLLDELLEFFSGSIQMSRTKPYIVTVTVTSRSFLGNQEPLKGTSLGSENDRSHFDTGRPERSAKWDELCL